jgi:hypothetical protein
MIWRADWHRIPKPSGSSGRPWRAFLPARGPHIPNR